MERSDQIGERLLGLVTDLNIDYEFEHSFKLFEKTLLVSRFLLSINKNKIKRNPHEKILDICKRITMPETFLKAFKGTLFDVNVVHYIDAVCLQGARTILMLTTDYEDLKRAISYNIIPIGVLKKLNEFYLNRASDKGVRVLMASYMLYFNDKFKRLVFDSEEQYISEKRRLNELVEQNKDCPLLSLNSNNALELLEIIKT